jgi:hypothetical protein
MRQMMMYTPCMSNYYLCIFLEIIGNKKIEESDGQMMMCTSYMSRDML